MSFTMDTKAHEAELALCKRNIRLLVAAQRSHSRWPSPLPYVQRLDNLTRKEFWALDLARGDGQFRYPLFSYNSLTLTGIIHWRPEQMHKGFFANEFRAAVQFSMIRLQPIVQEKCDNVGRDSTSFTRGKYVGSRNETSLKWMTEKENGLLSVTAVLEVGFTAQSYAQLLEDAQMWLEGHKDIQTFFLVKVEEDPEYTKRSSSDLSEDEIRNLLSMDEVDTSMAVPTNANSPFGPIQIIGLVWVGEVKAFLEVWKRGDTGARRRGSRYNILPDKSSDEHDITMSDFFSLDELSGGNEKFLLDWDRLRRTLKLDIQALAVKRCQDACYNLQNPEKQL